MASMKTPTANKEANFASKSMFALTYFNIYFPKVL